MNLSEDLIGILFQFYMLSIKPHT